jgi:hypothetical protein
VAGERAHLRQAKQGARRPAGRPAGRLAGWARPGARQPRRSSVAALTEPCSAPLLALALLAAAAPLLALATGPSPPCWDTLHLSTSMRG